MAAGRSDDIRRLASRCILQGFDGMVPPPELIREARAGALGGVVIFRRNVDTPAQVHDLLRELVSQSPPDAVPLCAVDQEGGRVVRIREPLTVLPPAAALGALDDPEFTRCAGHLVGLELRALGFTVNFAPVLDVNTNPASPVIGDRAFGPTAAQVVRHGLAFARGLRAGGVFPCAKHFPGHGDAAVDSHLGLPIVSHDEGRLREVELEPFAAWARTALGPVMSAHVVYPALDPATPATASRRILTGLLREQLHFNGVIFTDDLEMGAIVGLGGAAAFAVDILRAGADGLLVCRSLALRDEIIARLVDEAVRNGDFAMKLARAAVRLAPLAHPPGPSVPFSFVGSDEHAQLAQSVRARCLPGGSP